MADIYDQFPYTPQGNPPKKTPPATQEYLTLLKEVVSKRVPEYLADNGEQNNAEVQNAILFVLGNDRQFKSDPQMRRLADDFLNWMEMRSFLNDPSMTKSEYDASEAKQYALSEGGANNFEAAREYNLARGLQDSGRHSSPGSQFSDSMLAGVGSFFSNDMAMLQDARSSFAKDPTEARATEALYWWRQGQQENPDKPVWATGMTGAKLPEDSFSTFPGVMNTLSRTDNAMGAYGTMAENIRTGPGYAIPHVFAKAFLDKYGFNPRKPKASEYQTAISDAINSVLDVPAQQDIASRTRRKTPVVPDDPQKAAKVKDLGGVLERSEQWNQGAAKAYSPLFFESLGGDRRYFTPEEDAAQTIFSSVYSDPLSLLSGGGAGPLELLEETAFTAIPMANTNPDAPKLDPSKFSPEVYLDTSMGPEYIKADDPRYDTAYQARLQEERDRRRKMRQGF
jgi:hypothetical protein